MIYRFFLLFCFPLFLFSSAKNVELVANWPVDTAPYDAIFMKRGKDVHVIASDLASYGFGNKRKQSALGRFLHKHALDFWNRVSVKEEVEKIVFFNLTNAFRRDPHLRYLPKEKLILFLWEPPLILSEMYRSRSKETFSRIYTWDDDLVDGKQFFKFYYPELKPMIAQLPAFEEKKLCTFVGSCQKSAQEGCLYAERNNAIAFFESVGEEGFEFYGRKWDPSLYKSYRGPIDDKIETMKHYRFAIAYENSCKYNGYITEKIFDCFAAGVIPIYWGAPNVETYIPKECFIDRRDFENMEELYHFLKAMDKREYEGYLQRIRTFLASEQAQLFSKKHFEEIFFHCVFFP
jgi:alpha(1,3/1,4) fucosyltransferase